MPPAIITLILAPLVVLAAWSIMRDLATGEAEGEVYRYRIDTNPIGFILVVGGKVFLIVFGIAVILHAFGLVGDPIKPLRPIFEPFG